ncbi:MAG: nitrogen regulation protein NR(I) [Burkholderiaceae bacterium]
MNGVWIVDDDQSIRWVLERALIREGYAVRAFERASDCIDALSSDQPRVLVSDIRMPGVDGIEMLQQVKQSHPTLPVIIMTAFSDLESAVSAFQNGAFEYLAKPFDLSNAVDLIRRAVEEGGRGEESEVPAVGGMGILGQAPAMQEVFRAIGRLSQSPVTVLITGESGSGKELVAKALHTHSVRSDKPFVALNTAAIPHELLESELFGHERGAFTGAQQQRRGRFEQAEGGTLFLDEIGDMPADLQTRLLRVLSDGEYSRVGGTQSIRANVRVIAATHQALEERVKAGLFREDLYHRLNVIRIRLPSLRERREDIPLLASHFLAEAAAEMGTTPKRLTSEASDRLSQLDWPGNVRQLENACRWITVMAPTQEVGLSDLPPELLSARLPADAATPLAASELPASPVSSAALAQRAAEVVPGLGQSHGSIHSPAPNSVGRSPVVNGTGESVENFGNSLSNGGAGPAGTNAFQPGAGAPGLSVSAGHDWVSLLGNTVVQRLAQLDNDPHSEGVGDIMRELTREFESTVLSITLRHTKGRRIDAARLLGLGRNTITRKVQELKLAD